MIAIIPSYTQFFYGEVAITLADGSSIRQCPAHEIELKLEIEPLDAHALTIPDGAAAQAQLTVYYDTPSQALKEHGYTLRVRNVGDRFVQTVKPVTASAGLLARSEIEHSVESIEPNLSRLAGTPFESLVLGDLEPVIRSNVRRTSWMMEVGGSQIQADLDEGKMTAGGRSRRFDELELELLSGEPACLLHAAKEIAGRIPVRIGVLSKAERGDRLASGAFKKVAKAAAVEVDRSMTVAEAFEVMVHACLKHYRLNEPLVIGKRRPEALHQTRVAMRRLRSAFTLFKSAIADVEYQFLREELRWFTSQLGDARNLDVYLQRDLPDPEREPLIERREQAYDHVLAVMDSQRARSLMIELVGWTAFGPWRHGKQARRPVEGYASGRLDRLWHSIANIGHQLADFDEETRHELRIQVKKMRYAIEFLRGLYPQAAPQEKHFASAVEELQESLGKLNDLTTARTLGTPSVTDDGWLIGEPDGRVHLREARRAFHDLERVGPFWNRRALVSAKSCLEKV